MHKREKISIPKVSKATKVAIVVARFNDVYAKHLVKAAVSTLEKAGVQKKNITIEYVPGSFEIALGCKLLLEKGGYDGLLALGVMMEGETPHFEKLCGVVLQSISDLKLEYQVPIGFGVVMARNEKQAQERASTGAGNKGVEAAVAVLGMINYRRGLESPRSKKST